MMRIDSLRKFFEITILVMMSIFVAVFIITAIWELGPFYGYGLDNTVVQIIGQVVTGVLGTMFQFSENLYILYAFMSILIVFTPFFIIMVALHLGYFINLKLKRKQAEGKPTGFLERILALNVAKAIYRHLVGLADYSRERLAFKRAGEVANEEVPARRRQWKTYVWQITLIVTVALIVFTYRYAVLPVPQGWDTPYYIYIIRHMQLDPTLVIRDYFDRLLSLVIMSLVTSISGLMTEQAMVILTPVLGIALMVGVYLLVTTGTKNRQVALLAALYTSMTFGTLRMSMDLYSNFMSWGFAMYALVLYIRTMETKETRIKYILMTTFVFALTALAHAWTFMILTMIVLLHNLLELITSGNYRTTIKRSFFIYAPLILFALLKPSLVAEPLSFLALFSAPQPWKDASYENPYLLILAVIGIFAIMNHKQKTTYSKTLISWTILISTALILGIVSLPYRIFAVAPIAILAAHGTQAISNWTIRRLNSKSIGKPVLPLIVLVCFTAMLPNAYMPEYVLRPSNEAMAQLYWIEQHYGYQNQSLIVCAETIPPSASGLSYSNQYFWAMATVGDGVYGDPLLYLLQGFTDSRGHRFTNLTGKTILIPDKFYPMSPIEYAASQKISELGIYEVQFKNISQIDQIVKNKSIWLEDNFQKEQWKPNPPWVTLDYNYQVANESGIMNISVIPLHSDSWFDLEKNLSAPVHPSSHLIIKAKGNIHSLLFEVHVYSDSGLITWIDFTKYITPENYTSLQMDLSPDMAISYIRLSFYSATVINVESYVQVDYIALI